MSLKNKKIKIDNCEIELSHLDKILFPEANISKGDLINYYDKIAETMLPYVKNRIIVMQRFPNGIKGESFFQKERPGYFPAWIKEKDVKLKKGGSEPFVIVEKKADLIYLANQADITLHTWLSTANKPNYPNKIVFDLDPSTKGLEPIRFAAKKIKHILEQYGLTAFLMTTGSRGYHVVSPIKQTHAFDIVREFIKNIAHMLAEKYSDDLTVEMSKEKRGTRVFLDYLRNAYGQTSVAPYAVRAKPGAPIATPLDWNELSSTKPQDYTVKNIFRRLAQKEDPWKGMNRHAVDLKL